MIRNHSEEKDVQEAMILPIKSTERSNAWQKTFDRVNLMRT